MKRNKAVQVNNIIVFSQALTTEYIILDLYHPYNFIEKYGNIYPWFCRNVEVENATPNIKYLFNTHIKSTFDPLEQYLLNMVTVLYYWLDEKDIWITNPPTVESLKQVAYVFDIKDFIEQNYSNVLTIDLDKVLKEMVK